MVIKASYYNYYLKSSPPLIATCFFVLEGQGLSYFFRFKTPNKRKRMNLLLLYMNVEKSFRAQKLTYLRCKPSH